MHLARCIGVMLGAPQLTYLIYLSTRYSVHFRFNVNVEMGKILSIADLFKNMFQWNILYVNFISLLTLT